MKKIRTLLYVLLLTSLLTSCMAQPPQETTSAPFDTETTETPLSAETTACSDTTAESSFTSINSGTDDPIPEYSELPYTTKNLYMPISELYTVEDLQCRSGDGRGQYFTVVARVFNSGSTPLVVKGGTLSVDYGKNKATGIHSMTPFYVMPLQTGFVVLRSFATADDDFDEEKVKYTYTVHTEEAKKQVTVLMAESTTATIEHYGNEIGSISFEITLKDPPTARLMQADVVLWNEDGIAIDAFSQKTMHKDGKVSFSFIPDKNIDKNDIASYSFSLTSQCNE